MISLAARALEVLGPRGCPLVGSVSDGWTASFEGSSSEASAALPTLTHAPPQRGFQGVGRSVGPDSRLSHWTVLRLIPVRYEREHPGELLHVGVKKLGRIRPGGGWRKLERSSESKVGRVAVPAMTTCTCSTITPLRVRRGPPRRTRRDPRELRAASRRSRGAGRAGHDRSSEELRALERVSPRRYRDRCSTPPDPSLPPPDEWQGRAVQPHHARRVSLRTSLPLERSALERSEPRSPASIPTIGADLTPPWVGSRRSLEWRQGRWNYS